MMTLKEIKPETLFLRNFKGVGLAPSFKTKESKYITGLGKCIICINTKGEKVYYPEDADCIQ